MYFYPNCIILIAIHMINNNVRLKFLQNTSSILAKAKNFYYTKLNYDDSVNVLFSAQNAHNANFKIQKCQFNFKIIIITGKSFFVISFIMIFF